MSTYSDGLWVTATTDEAANSFDQIVSTAFVETAGVGAVLVAASSQADFDNRLALSTGSLASIAAKVAPESAEAVLGALVDRWTAQWRTAQMQRQAGARELIAWGKGLFRETPRSWDEWVVRAGEFIQARDYAYTDGEATATNGPDALYALAAVLAAAKAAGVTTALELSEYATIVSGMPGIFGSKEAINAPYRIKERDGKFLVVNDAGETKGTHETWDDARQHQKAMYANVPGAPEMAKDKKQKREQDSKAASRRTAVGATMSDHLLASYKAGVKSGRRSQLTDVHMAYQRTRGGWDERQWCRGYMDGQNSGAFPEDLFGPPSDTELREGAARTAYRDPSGRVWNPGWRSSVMLNNTSRSVIAVAPDGLSGFAEGRGYVFWRRKNPGKLHTISDDGQFASEKVTVHEVDTVVIDGSIWGVPGKKIGTGIVGLERDQEPGYDSYRAELLGLRFTGAARSAVGSRRVAKAATRKAASDGCPYCGLWGCSPTCPGPTTRGVCPKCGAGTSDGRCDDPQGCGWGWEGSDRGLTFDGEPRIVWGSRKAASDDDAPAAPSSSPIPADPVAQGQVDAGSAVVGDVLIDVKNGVAVTYTVSAAERQEGDILLSVTRDDGESMDLLMPASAPVQIVQGRGPDDPIEEDKPKAKPKADDKKADDKAKKDEGGEKDEDKPKKKPKSKKKSGLHPIALGEVMGGALRTLGYGDGYGGYVSDYLDDNAYDEYLTPSADELATEVSTDIPALPQDPYVEEVDPTLDYVESQRRVR